MKVYNPNAIGVTTGFGVPTGGTSGQALVKNSSTNYDTQWRDTRVFMYALNSDRANFTPGFAIGEFTAVESAGGITLANNQFTLPAGYTFELEGAVTLDTSSVDSTAVTYRWKTGTTNLGNGAVIASVDRNTSPLSLNPVAKAVITTTAPTVVFLNCQTETPGQSATRANFGYIMIKAI